MSAPDESVVQIEGPWKHRAVHANGTRFHVAEARRGAARPAAARVPAVLVGLAPPAAALAAAGFRAAAMDLRGYGGSDKPPRGYDLPTLAADVAGLIRALGERDAIVVGHDWGGLLAWTHGGARPEVRAPAGRRLGAAPAAAAAGRC